jgi:hypothetical protein
VIRSLFAFFDRREVITGWLALDVLWLAVETAPLWGLLWALYVVWGCWVLARALTV